MKSPRNLLYLLLLFFCLGCKSQMFVLSPAGDNAKIIMQNNTDIIAELLAVNDDVLFVNVISGNEALGISNEEIFIGLRFDEITEIVIQDYKNNDWVAPWIAFQVIPPFLLGYAASTVDVNFFAVWLTYSIPAVVSAVSLGIGGPKKPSFSNDFTSEKLSEIKKYVRYPLGLNDGQLKKVAEFHGQSEYRILNQKN